MDQDGQEKKFVAAWFLLFVPAGLQALGESLKEGQLWGSLEMQQIKSVDYVEAWYMKGDDDDTDL